MRKYFKPVICIPVILIILITIYIGFIRSGTSILNIGAADNGRRIEIVKGQTIRLFLDTNPTTGFGWHDVLKPNPKVLRLTRHFSKSNNNVLPGSPSVECWVYRCSGSGTTDIKLKYNRLWDKDVPPVKIFHIKVTGQ